MKPGQRKSYEPFRERNDEIAALWLEGNRATAIAWRLGVSRNVVLGVIDRRGLLRHRERSDKHAAVTGGGEAMARVPRRGCLYPNGEPEEPGFKFCGAPVMAGRPYCAEHCAACYRIVEVSIGV